MYFDLARRQAVPRHAEGFGKCPVVSLQIVAQQADCPSKELRQFLGFQCTLGFNYSGFTGVNLRNAQWFKQRSELLKPSTRPPNRGAITESLREDGIIGRIYRAPSHPPIAGPKGQSPQPLALDTVVWLVELSELAKRIEQNGFLSLGRFAPATVCDLFNDV